MSLFQLDVLFGNLPEMVEFQVEFLKTLEDGTRLVPDLEKLERVEQFKVWFMFLLKHTSTQQQQQKLQKTYLLPSFLTENPFLTGRLFPLLCRPI